MVVDVGEGDPPPLGSAKVPKAIGYLQSATELRSEGGELDLFAKRRGSDSSLGGWPGGGRLRFNPDRKSMFSKAL